MDIIEIFKEEPLITFETYFAILKAKNSKIKDHHKVPMAVYLKLMGVKKQMATRKEFENIFSNY